MLNIGLNKNPNWRTNTETSNHTTEIFTYRGQVDIDVNGEFAPVHTNLNGDIQFSSAQNAEVVNYYYVWSSRLMIHCGAPNKRACLLYFSSVQGLQGLMNKCVFSWMEDRMFCVNLSQFICALSLYHHNWYQVDIRSNIMSIDTFI